MRLNKMNCKRKYTPNVSNICFVKLIVSTVEENELMLIKSKRKAVTMPALSLLIIMP